MDSLSVSGIDGGAMKPIIQIAVLLMFIGVINSTARSDTSIRYVLCGKNVKTIEIIPQGKQYSLGIALTESAKEEFFYLTKSNIGKTLNIEFEDTLISGADIEVPINSGYILTIPATKEDAERLRQGILYDELCLNFQQPLQSTERHPGVRYHHKIPVGVLLSDPFHIYRVR